VGGSHNIMIFIFLKKLFVWGRFKRIGIGKYLRLLGLNETRKMLMIVLLLSRMAS
jgi:hypothetical protein